MTTRTATAVIVRAVMLTHEGDERAVYNGPFLPHVGSATTSFTSMLERELEVVGAKPADQQALGGELQVLDQLGDAGDVHDATIAESPAEPRAIRARR